MPTRRADPALPAARGGCVALTWLAVGGLLANGCEDECPCVDNCAAMQHDPINCGACYVACAAGESCVQGECVCAPPSVLCDGECMSCREASRRLQSCDDGCFYLVSDHANCGECGRTCGPTETCSGGSCYAGNATGCEESCDVGRGFVCCKTEGGDRCANVWFDEENCVVCGATCPSECSLAAACELY